MSKCGVGLVDGRDWSIGFLLFAVVSLLNLSNCQIWRFQCLPLLHWAAGGDCVSLGVYWRASIWSICPSWGQHWQNDPFNRYKQSLEWRNISTEIVLNNTNNYTYGIELISLTRISHIGGWQTSGGLTDEILEFYQLTGQWKLLVTMFLAWPDMNMLCLCQL